MPKFLIIVIFPEPLNECISGNLNCCILICVTFPNVCVCKYSESLTPSASGILQHNNSAIAVVCHFRCSDN